MLLNFEISPNTLFATEPYTRRIIGFGVHAGDVHGVALCYMFNKVIAGMGVSKYLSSDNDPLFTYHRWQASLRVLDVEEIKSIPYTPTSHPFVERLIGTVRGEYLDQVLFWNTTDLERKLDTLKRYYNESRTHASLDGNTPYERRGGAVLRPATFDNFIWEPHCGGLFHLPIAA